jgi:multidrug efflux system outer membrane protein
MSRTSTLIALLLLTSCISPVGEQASGIDTPNFWQRLVGGDAENAPLAADEKAPVEQAWWQHFNDPTLDKLIGEALANNKTLGIAKARVAEARAARVGARAILLPQIDGVASSTRGNRGVFTGTDKPITASEAGVEANWELDLFGKNQANAAAASALLQSEEDTQHAVRVSLLAEVARTYFDLRNLEQQLDLTQQNLKSQNKTLELTKAQLSGALASDFDVQRAAAQVSTTAAQIPSLQIARDAAVNRLNVLLGYPPGSKNALLDTKPAIAPLDQKIIVTAPATVLATRPDVSAAERRFAASISASDAATRALFPNISLLGFFGVQDAPLGASSPWSLGAGLVQPILNFGTISSQIDAADARQQQAYLAYQQTVLEALEDMENALSNYLNETNRNKALRDAAIQSRKAAKLAREQFTNGYSPLLDVLVAERTTLEAEAAATASDMKLRQDLIHVYTAAGGGWKTEEVAKN